MNQSYFQFFSTYSQSVRAKKKFIAILAHSAPGLDGPARPRLYAMALRGHDPTYASMTADLRPEAELQAEEEKKRQQAATSRQRAELLAKRLADYWPSSDSGGTDTDSGCVPDASKIHQFLSGFRDKFQKRVTCVAFSIEFAKTN